MPQQLPLVIVPATNLRQPSRLIQTDEFADSNFIKLVADMMHTMHTDDGIGLAAPQIGHNIRLITIGADAFSGSAALPFSTDADLALINPEIETYSWKTAVDEEGCLSVPGYAGSVERHVTISVKAPTRDGAAITFTAHDYFARVLQHEIDHLNGVLYIDRAKEVWKLDRVSSSRHL